MRWRNILIVAGITLPISFVLWLGFGHDPHAVPSVLPGRSAPACALHTLDDMPVQLAEFRGKPLLLNFWSTWCVPCKREHGLLQEAAGALSDKIQFLGVVYQDSADNVRTYLAERGSQYQQVLDSSSRCAIDYGVAGVPESFFIDAAGKVRHKEVGPLTPATLNQGVRSVITAEATP